MTTSGTATTDLSLNELVEEAFERCGKEMRSGYDLRTARRSLNLLMMEWANHGINLWTIDSGTVSLTADTITYNLPIDMVDILDMVVRTGSADTQSDLVVTRISQTTYSTIPNKNENGRPTQIWINRQGGQTDPTDGIRYPTINVWPVPSDGSYTFVYWYLRRIQDFSTGANTSDVPFRFVPALVAGLAYRLAQKIPEAAPLIPQLKADYNETMQMAKNEDREKATLRLVPRIYR